MFNDGLDWLLQPVEQLLGGMDRYTINSVPEA
jgi:hypothetical protein